MTDAQLEQLYQAVEELRDELRRSRSEGLVVRLPDGQIEEIAYRVLERVDERLANPEPTTDTAPSRQPPPRFRLPGARR